MVLNMGVNMDVNMGVNMGEHFVLHMVVYLKRGSAQRFKKSCKHGLQHRC